MLTYLLGFILIVNLVQLSNAYQCFELKNLNTDSCNQCEYGSECVLSSSRTNRNITCKCIENCYSYGDSVDSRTVCAEDANIYNSVCHLKKHSCESKRQIAIKYVGKCGM